MTPGAFVFYFSVFQFLLPLQNGNYFKDSKHVSCAHQSNSFGPLQTRSMLQLFVSYETIALKRLVFPNSHWLFYSEISFRKVRAIPVD